MVDDEIKSAREENISFISARKTTKNNLAVTNSIDLNKINISTPAINS